MFLKKIISTSVILVSLMIISFLAAKNVFFSVQEVQLIKPQTTVISKDIYTTGKVEEKSKSEVTASFPFVAGEVNVQVGDEVSVNQVVCEVDIEATKDALLNLSEYSSLIPDEYKALLDIENLNIDKILKSIPQKILSPANGVITALNVQNGSVCNINNIICVVSDTSDIRVSLTVDENYADMVNEDDIVVFKASATQDKQYYGKVESIFPTAVETITGTSAQTVVGLYVDLLENYDRLKPGYTVTGVIKKLGNVKKLTIPYEAIMQDENNQEYVYVYKDARAVRKDIITGDELEDSVVIENGLSEDDIVIKNAQDIKEENCFIKKAE